MKKLFKIFLFFFLLVNVIAFFHAYKFTHFTDKNVVRTDENTALGFFQKMKLAVFGIDNPRPENNAFPKRPYKTVYINSDVKLEAWQIKSENAKGTVIFFHGYAGKKSDMIARSEIIADNGYHVLLVDFKGSGGSEGNSTSVGYGEAGEVKDCYDHVVKTGEKNIYLFGTSMGAAAILKCLNDHPVKPSGIILECPFGSMYKTVCARFTLMDYPSFPMAGILMFWGGIQHGYWAFSHNPTAYAKKVNSPALLLYGEKDTRVSKTENEEIFEHLAGKKQLVTFPESGHESYLLKYEAEWTSAVLGFLGKHGGYGNQKFLVNWDSNHPG